jgi:hypothetical protein
MSKLTARERDYLRLSKWVQRVILRLGTYGPGMERAGDERQQGASSADRAERCARNLEFSAAKPKEANALRVLGESLATFQSAKGSVAQDDSHAEVVAAAEELGEESSEFVNPPLSAIWANANRTKEKDPT